MNAKVEEIMTASPVTASRHTTVAHARATLASHGFSALPIVDPDGTPVGIVTTSDLVAPDLKETTPLSALAGEKLYTVPQYEDVSVAARMMRNHRIHHLLVTHEKRVVGLVSSFDLLRLVEEHRFVAKAPPTATAKKKGARAKQERA